MNPKEQLTRLAAPIRTSLETHRMVWLVILAGLVLLLLPGGESPQIEEPQSAQTQFDLRDMEDRLSEALSKIDGAGEVTVVLAVRDGPRQVLAQDSREEQGETETVVISRGSSTQETVTVQELYPSYQGALLVCPGGDDPTVCLKLTEATSALTGLGADKISISKGK